MMINLVVGAALLALIYYGIKAFANANPQNVMRLARAAGGWALLALAGFLGLRGQIGLALPVAFFALPLIGYDFRTMITGPGSVWSRMRRSSGRTSHVRSAMLDMTLDHDSGRLSGTVISGTYAGRSLDELDIPTLLRFGGGIDGESRALLEAYLDRRDARWRENAERDMGARSAGAARGGAMTEQEAYDVLGLQAGAGADAIRQAHRGLMQKLHPDRGGSNYLAARVNEAKDVLLSRHR